MDTTMDNAVATTVRADLAPTTEEVALLTRQYQKALDGLFEAYQFGRMLLAVKARLEDALDGVNGERQTVNGGALTGDGQAAEPLQIAGSSSDAARGTAREITIGNNGNLLTGSGWNRGTGLKGWLAAYCPEINYSTARRFLAVAEKTVAALALSGEGESGERQSENGLPDAPDGADRSPLTVYRSPDPDKVRAFLAGRSQRSILRLGGKREGAGRKAKDWAAALNAAPEIAWKELSEPLDRLSDLIVRQRRHAALTAQDLHTLRDAIDLLHEVIHADA